jgi:hypothetical protein
VDVFLLFYSGMLHGVFAEANSSGTAVAIFGAWLVRIIAERISGPLRAGTKKETKEKSNVQDHEPDPQ